MYVKKINPYGTSHTTTLPVKLHTENPIMNYTHGISSDSRISLPSCLLTFCKHLAIYSECNTSIHIVKFHNVFFTLIQRQCYTFWPRLQFCFNEGSMFCTWNALPFEVQKKGFASSTHCITHSHNAKEMGGGGNRHRPQISSQAFSAQPYPHGSFAVKTEVMNYSWVWKNSLTPSKKTFCTSFKQKTP